MKKLITGLVMIMVVLTLVSCNRGTTPSNDGSSPVTFFPVQKAGLGQVEALMEGELVLVNGYLRVQSDYSETSHLLIWPHGFSLNTEDEEIKILDEDGKVVAQVGDNIKVGGGEKDSAAVKHYLTKRLPRDATGPYWVVGNFVDVNSPPPESERPEKYAEIFEKYKDNPELFEVAIYAEHNAITMEEAIARFELMDDAGPLGAELETQERGTFAGLWIEHQPGFRVVIAFTENGEETVKKYVEEDSLLADVIELRTFEVTYEELQAAQQEAHQLLSELGLSVSSSIDIKENQVEVYVTDSELFHNTLQESGEKLPEYVVAIVIYEPLDEIPFDINPDPSVHFPQLKMASGSYMLALLIGKLTLEDGYLRVDGRLLIWQPDYFVHNNEGTIEILNRDGVVVGRVGEEIYMGGGEIPYIDSRLLREPLPADTKGPYWMMGDTVRLD